MRCISFIGVPKNLAAQRHTKLHTKPFLILDYYINHVHMYESPAVSSDANLQKPGQQ